MRKEALRRMSWCLIMSYVISHNDIIHIILKSQPPNLIIISLLPKFVARHLCQFKSGRQREHSGSSSPFGAEESVASSSLA